MATEPAWPRPEPVHLDAQVLVLDKPAGLLCVPGRGPDKQDCLSARVQAHWPEAQIVHRLDMATSGLVLMARGSAMQRHFSQCFAQRQIDKRYEALVWGTPAVPAGVAQTIDLPLAIDWPNRPRSRVDPAGKPSQTRWRLLGPGPWPGTSRLALEPLTGRTHQLRLHCLAMGHPILGDALYAPPEALALSPRLCLHACALAWPDAQDPARTHQALSPASF
jgi:tRNA pseudouridine32 synthase/23S rRNA pseudouridine746 synthase